VRACVRACVLARGRARSRVYINIVFFTASAFSMVLQWLYVVHSPAATTPGARAMQTSSTGMWALCILLTIRLLFNTATACLLPLFSLMSIGY